MISPREHYEIEKELAARLRSAAPHERRELYISVYDEVYRRVFRPRWMANSKLDQVAALNTAEAIADAQVRLLRSFLRPSFVFLEVGANDFRVVREMAKLVAKAYAVDITRERAQRAVLPDNVEFCLSDGTSIPVPANSVNVAYSNQVMEHLHPDDAYEQLRNIHCALAPGGKYLCLTPNRLSGPHDISRDYDDVASGLHLKEYSICELADAFTTVGFSSVRVFLSAAGRRLSPSIPVQPVRTFEALLAQLPRSARMRAALGLCAIKVIGTK